MNSDEWVEMEHVDRVAIMRECEDKLGADGVSYNYRSCLLPPVCALIEGARATLPSRMHGLPGTVAHTKVDGSRFKYTVHHPHGTKLYDAVNTDVCPFGCSRRLVKGENRYLMNDSRAQRVPVYHKCSTRHPIGADAVSDVLKKGQMFGLTLGTDFQITKEPLERSCVMVSDHTLFCDYIAGELKEAELTSVQPGKITPFFQDRLSASGVTFGHAACPLGLPAERCKNTWRFYEGLDRYAYKDITTVHCGAVVGLRIFLSRLYRGVYFEADHDIFVISTIKLLTELLDVFDLIFMGRLRSPPVLHTTKNNVPLQRQTTHTYKIAKNESAIPIITNAGFIRLPTRNAIKGLIECE